jgi:hypothetical protein
MGLQMLEKIFIAVDSESTFWGKRAFEIICFKRKLKYKIAVSS